MTGAAAHPFLLDALRDRDSDEWPDPGSEWPCVLDAARSQGVIQLLYARLRRSDERSRRAGPWLEALRRESFRVAARSLELSVELADLLAAFEAAAAPCVPLRGPALAERLYGERTARPMGDLDLLVRRADIPRVRDLLIPRGYRELDRRRGFAERYSYTLEFYRERRPAVVVEPHWTIAYPPAAARLGMDSVWARCVAGSVLGITSRSLCAADLLLNLCLHLIHADRAAPLLWHYEIDRLIRREADALDWAVFVETVRQAGVESSVSIALVRVTELFDTPLPGHVQRRLGAGSGAPAFTQRVAETSVDGRESLALLFDLGGPRAKLRYALAILFPAPDFMRVHCGLSGARRLGLAYLGRLCRFTVEAMKGFLLAGRQLAGHAGRRR